MNSRPVALQSDRIEKLEVGQKSEVLKIADGYAVFWCAARIDYTEAEKREIFQGYFNSRKMLQMRVLVQSIPGVLQLFVSNRIFAGLSAG